MTSHARLPTFRFRPLSCSWVALHPYPRGVIQFIGGAFFGTWPTLFYRYLLQYLYEQGYTIIALPFRFSFRHWSISATLYAEQLKLRPLLMEEAKALGYDPNIYRKQSCYYWLGHSMGCKYIALLECLSDPRWEQLLRDALGAKDAASVIRQLRRYDPVQPVAIVDQSSVLMAPDISDTESAIPSKKIAQRLDTIGLGVLPTRTQTQKLITTSDLFNLTAVISFDRDTIAGSAACPHVDSSRADESDVRWLLDVLQARPVPTLAADLSGKHLEPMGLVWGLRTWNPFGIVRWQLFQRPLESTLKTVLEKLRGLNLDHSTKISQQ